ALIYYWRLCHKHPEAAMLLAVFPLIFAWRSLPSYFYCAIFPIFLLMNARHLPDYYGARRHNVPFIFGGGEQAVRRQIIPAPIGVRAAMQVVSLFRGMISPGWFASADCPLDRPPTFLALFVIQSTGTRKVKTIVLARKRDRNESQEGSTYTSASFAGG